MRAPPPKLSEKNLKRVYHAGLETIGKDSELTGDAAFDDFMRRAEAAEEGNRNELLEDFRTRYIRTKYSLDERREQVLELKEAYARLKTNEEELSEQLEGFTAVYDKLLKKQEIASERHAWEKENKIQVTVELSEARDRKGEAKKERDAAYQRYQEAKVALRRQQEAHRRAGIKSGKYKVRLERVLEEVAAHQRLWKANKERAANYSAQLESLRKQLDVMKTVVDQTIGLS